MIKKLFPLLALLLAACGPSNPVWVLRHEPTTDEERKAVAEHVEKILAATPKSLSGHDQDWDDAIRAAHTKAAESLCRPTLWEIIDWRETGRFRYVEAVK